MYKLFWSTVIVCALCLRQGIAVAAEIAGGNTHLASAASPVSISYAMQILISFLAVIGFILLLAWFMRKTGRYGAGSNQVLKVISSMSLGMREKILLIEVEGVGIVVGVAPGQITALHVLERGVTAEGNRNVRPYKDNNVFSQLIAKLSK